MNDIQKRNEEGIEYMKLNKKGKKNVETTDRHTIERRDIKLPFVRRSADQGVSWSTRHLFRGSDKVARALIHSPPPSPHPAPHSPSPTGLGLYTRAHININTKTNTHTVYIFGYMCIHMHIFIKIYIMLYIYVCLCGRSYAYVCIYLHVCLRVCLRNYVHVCQHSVRIRVCVRARKPERVSVKGAVCIWRVSQVRLEFCLYVCFICFFVHCLRWLDNCISDWVFFFCLNLLFLKSRCSVQLFDC